MMISSEKLWSFITEYCIINLNSTVYFTLLYIIVNSLKVSANNNLVEMNFFTVVKSFLFGKKILLDIYENIWHEAMMNILIPIYRKKTIMRQYFVHTKMNEL